MMFGYAIRDNKYYLPTAMVILQELSKEYDKLRKKINDSYLMVKHKLLVFMMIKN